MQVWTVTRLLPHTCLTFQLVIWTQGSETALSHRRNPLALASWSNCRISLLRLHLPFPCIQVRDSKRPEHLHCLSFSPHNRGLHAIPGTAANFPGGFEQEKNNASTCLLWTGFKLCDIVFWLNRVASHLIWRAASSCGEHPYRLSFSSHQAQHKPFGSRLSWPWSILPCL